ncbi:MAG TPA: hypothetical protein ENJ82_14495 [Bacteroidetes bacterium]|nr:hypothetical protein [Bacteroidota bacterium]
MNTSNTDRPRLKSYFVTNAVPTQDQFEELIEASFNQTSDGLSKTIESSLCIQAGNGNSQEVLDLYRDFLSRKPDWRFELNPLRTPTEANSSNPGLALRDEAGRIRLYLNDSKPLAGFGTLDPRAGLHVVVDMAEQRNTGTAQVPVLEVWGYQGLDSDEKIALILGENENGKLGSVKLNGSTLNEFSFLRPGAGDLFLDTTSANFYFNYDEVVRRNKGAVMHLANASGANSIRLNTQGTSWLNGGRLGLGTENPAAALQVRVAGATGTDFSQLQDKIALHLGDDTSNGTLLMQGGTVNDRVFQHGAAGAWHLDASAGQYALNQGNLAQGRAGILEIGDASLAAGIRLDTDGPSFLKNRLSVGTTDSRATLHLAAVGQGFAGLLIEKSGAETIKIDHESILVENGRGSQLFLQRNGALTEVGGDLFTNGGIHVAGGLDLSQATQFGMGKDAARQTLALVGVEGVSIHRTDLGSNYTGFQQLLNLEGEGETFVFGMERQKLHLGAAGSPQTIGIEPEGRVTVNLEEATDASLAVRGRVDVTGIGTGTPFGNWAPFSDIVRNQSDNIPAQLIISSVESDLVIASSSQAGKSALTLAIYDPTNANGNAYQFQMEQSSQQLDKLTWTGRTVPASALQGPVVVDPNDWRMMEFDAELRRTGIGRGKPAVALDVEGSGTPADGVQLLLRETSQANLGNNTNSEGVSIGFASPHFQHADLPAYDHFDLAQESQGNPPQAATSLPVLAYLGMIGTKQNLGNLTGEYPRLEISSRYDLPIELRVNNTPYMQLKGNQTAGIVQIGEQLDPNNPGPRPFLPLTFEVHAAATFSQPVHLGDVLSVDGAANLGAGLHVTGATELDNAIVNGTLAVSAMATVQHLETTAGAEIAGLLDVKSNAIIANGLEVTAGISALKGGVEVAGDTTLSGNVAISGNVGISDSLTVAQTVSYGAPNMNRGFGSFRVEPTLNTSGPEWKAMTFVLETDHPSLLELEIWDDKAAPELYARIKCFVGRQSGSLDFREIEIFQKASSRYIAGFRSNDQVSGLAIWLKPGDYKFRSSDAVRIEEGIWGTFPSTFAPVIAVIGPEYDHSMIRIARGLLTHDRFESLVAPV